MSTTVKRICCGDCNVEMNVSSLKRHLTSEKHRQKAKQYVYNNYPKLLNKQECSVCLTTKHEVVALECFDTHIVCKQCYEKIDCKCPLCRVSFEKKRIVLFTYSEIRQLVRAIETMIGNIEGHKCSSENKCAAMELVSMACNAVDNVFEDCTQDKLEKLPACYTWAVWALRGTRRKLYEIRDGIEAEKAEIRKLLNAMDEIGI